MITYQLNYSGVSIIFAFTRCKLYWCLRLWGLKLRNFRLRLFSSQALPAATFTFYFVNVVFYFSKTFFLFFVSFFFIRLQTFREFYNLTVRECCFHNCPVKCVKFWRIVGWLLDYRVFKSPIARRLPGCSLNISKFYHIIF